MLTGYLFNMIRLFQNWYISAGVVVLLILGIVRLGFLRGILTVGIGCLLVLNCYYYMMVKPNPTTYGTLISLFLGAVGLMLFLYALIFSEPGK